MNALKKERTMDKSLILQHLYTDLHEKEGKPTIKKKERREERKKRNKPKLTSS